MASGRPYSYCSKCGAVTIYRGVERYACMPENIGKYMPGLELDSASEKPATDGCLHCEENLGMDLCGCGSGELFGQCSRERRLCAAPSQVICIYEGLEASSLYADRSGAYVMVENGSRRLIPWRRPKGRIPNLAVGCGVPKQVAGFATPVVIVRIG